MYLSQRSNGSYYIYYPQLNGKFTCISTKTKLKSEALKFLSQFEAELKERIAKKTLKSVTGKNVKIDSEGMFLYE